MRIGKPDPAPYLAGAALLGVDPRRCLVVEDAPAGVTAGLAAGAQVIGVRTTHPDLAAPVVLDSLDQVEFSPDRLGVVVSY